METTDKEREILLTIFLEIITEASEEVHQL
jgi:hypothetical protein